MYATVFMVLAPLSVYARYKCSPLKYRIIMIVPSLVYAYYLAEYNTFLALLPSFLFHSITIMQWKQYVIMSALEMITAVLSTSMSASIPFWFVFGFLLCMLERTRKYSWILRDSNRKSAI